MGDIEPDLLEDDGVDEPPPMDRYKKLFNILDHSRDGSVMNGPPSMLLDKALQTQNPNMRV